MSTETATREMRILRRIFGIITGSDTPHSLYRALELGLVPSVYLGQARAIVESYPYPRRPTRGLAARKEDASPSWDNVVRAYEDCWDA